MRTSTPIALLFALLSVNTMSVQAKEAAEIQACIQANFPYSQKRIEFSINSNDRTGGQRQLEAVGYTRQADSGNVNMMLKINAPTGLKNTRLLLLEKTGRDDIFMALPKMSKPRQIRGSQKSAPLWGTDFSYEDIRHVQGLSSQAPIVVDGEVTIAERANWQIHIVPSAAEESSYVKIEMLIDQATCLLTQALFYEKTGTARKQLNSAPKGFVQTNQHWEATHFLMKDLRDETQTELIILKHEAKEDLPAAIFSPRNFSKSG